MISFDLGISPAELLIGLRYGSHQGWRFVELWALPGVFVRVRWAP